jgi:ribose 5-phosphate isomerase B
MKIAIGSDHGGYALKERLTQFLTEQGYKVEDFGTDSAKSCDYPAFGVAAARAVASGECDRGIVICTTGIGMSIAANRIRGVRCAHVTEPLTAEMCRRHNDANMIALGAGITGANLAERCVEVFLTTGFEGGRHARRVAMLDEIEP